MRIELEMLSLRMVLMTNQQEHWLYSEIKPLLPDITNVNLRKITFRAKKIYILFDGIEINRIQIISCSTSAISNLYDNQIQDIINDFPKKATNTDDEDSVPNWNGHVTSK